jgi:phosphatidylserine synthase
MFNWYRKWNQRHLDRHLAKWEAKRKKGRSYYISGIALFWSLVVTAIQVLLRLLFGEPVSIVWVVMALPMLFIGGLLIGWLNWNSLEKEYLQRHP